MFNKATEEKMRMTHRDKVTVYYELKRTGKKEYYLLFEKYSWWSGWAVIGDYKTFNEAQEVARSRAKHVVDLGLYENGHRRGTMGFFEEITPPTRKVVGTPGTFEETDEVEVKRLPVGGKKSAVTLPEEKPATVTRGGSAFTFQK
jgi:hypothetical protein